jgi:uncharacterized membrane protein YphA (DoxX/SURF4 family)
LTRDDERDPTSVVAPAASPRRDPIRAATISEVNAVTALAVCSGLAFVVYGAMCLTSASMQAEFTRFGLERFKVLTGILEMLGGVGLLVGLKWPPALWLSSAASTIAWSRLSRR